MHSSPPLHTRGTVGWLTATACACLLLLCAFPGLTAAQEYRIQCGDTIHGYESVFGPFFVPDKPYSPVDGYGYSGGYSLETTLDSRWFFGGTPDQELCMIGRAGYWAYRFDVPPGDYILTLHFMEIEHHGPGFRRFDISAEDVVLLEGIDLFELVEKDYAYRHRFLVSVTDGQLLVRGLTDVGAPFLGAVEVLPAVPDGTPPPVPSGFDILRAYEAVVLTWSYSGTEDLKGYRIYRSDDGADFTPIALTDGWPHRYVDQTGQVGETYWYRVSAVDLFGNESATTAADTATVLDRSATALPIYGLTLTESQLHDLNDDVWSEELVPCIFTGNDFDFRNASVRYRGASSREFHKKSYKIDFGPDVLFEGQSRFNLNSNFGDNSLIRARLGLLLNARLGVPASRDRPCRLYLNDTDRGVFGCVENVDDHFLDRVGLDASGGLYKCTGNLSVMGSLEEYQGRYVNQLGDPGEIDSLVSFIEELNSVPEATFPAWVGQNLHVDEILTEYAVNILIANNDFTGDNYFLHQDSQSGKWSIIPWDLDSTWRISDRPINHGTPESPDVWGHNVLITRLLETDLFRYVYTQELVRAIDGIFSETSMFAIIDSLFNEIAYDGLRDVHKIDFEVNTNFLRRPDELKTFVSERITYLSGEIPGFTTDPGGFVVINEFLASNDTTLADEHGDFDDWLELYNPTTVSFDLQGVGLTDDHGQPYKWAFPDTAIGPGEWLIVWADDEPAEGPLHATFKLSASGEEIAIYDRAERGGRILDALTFGVQAPDVSVGRFPDGAPDVRAFATPTPGWANSAAGNLPPGIRDVGHEPLFPGADEPVVVTATVTDSGTVEWVGAHVELNGVPQLVAELRDDGNSGDGAAGDGVFGGTIPGYPDESRVSYFIEAVDDSGAVRLAPPDADEPGGGRYEYWVGFSPPEIAVNEFLASNETTNADDYGEYDDWIELCNCGAGPINVTQLYLTDDHTRPDKWQLPPIELGPGEFMLVWADDSPDQGVLHAPFKLSAGGEEIGVYASGPVGLVPVDTLTFGPQSTDISLGRDPDCEDPWRLYGNPTPGESNAMSSAGVVTSAPPTVDCWLTVSPNPCPRGPRIRLDLPRASRVALRLFDVRGRLVSAAGPIALPTGRHLLAWPGDRDGLAAGVYFLEVRADHHRRVNRIVLVR